MANIIRIPPHHFIHVLDTNSNVTRLDVGPKIFIKQDHEKVVTGKDPVPMTSIPPRSFAVINNPVIRNPDKSLSIDKYGQVNVRHGDQEIRFHEDYPDPFPLYPREEIIGRVTALRVVAPDTALLIESERAFTDEEENKRQPGDLWYFKGPGTYYPRIEERVVREVEAKKIKVNQALKLRAQRELTDIEGNIRKAGEDWLIRTPGAYLPGVYETVIETLEAKILTDYKAIAVRATRAFIDVYGIKRKAGEEWLVTSEMSPLHIIDVYEEFIGDVKITVLDKNQYCVVLDPFDKELGTNRYGFKEQRWGERSFFLIPGESLEGGIKNKYILADDEALLLRAKEGLHSEGEDRKPGDRWMIYGPCSYMPPTQVEILEVRKAIPLHINEGIYVRDIKSGQVRSEIGKSYMLKPHEELWEMELSDVVEELLSQQGQARTNKTRVVTYKCPANSIVQVYDYKSKVSRTVLGPNLVMLSPDEQFTVNILSGGKPKRVGVIKTLHLMLGPDFSTDIIEVDTSDHCRLRLQLSYNWKFNIDKSDEETHKQVFKVRDFVGNLCNFMASRVRGAVAGASFDQFHRESARIIRKSVFGLDESGHVNDDFKFDENNLVLTNVDIQSVEPVDRQTKERLQESVTMAIEITTQTEEAKARHASERQAQEAEGQLEKLRIEGQLKVEAENNKLYLLKSQTENVESEGIATATAKAMTEKNRIEAQSKKDAAELNSRAEKLKRENEINHTKEKQSLEIEYQRKIDDLEITKARRLAEIESEKFKGIIRSIGSDTLVAISEAGPKMQAELLGGLGLTGYMLCDTENPINLFNTAQGMLGAAANQQPNN
ncbi:unnamed protein product [Blepharisma stoltei]|uniref:Major vault protein n=1 Tax=Blepharisma stoltei TaxID=1481888 RepID=A0AAU9J921_9CILI|nr:unnamed protein product [Blepharisma stoltei]